MSETKPGMIYELLPKIAREVGAVAKDKKNEKQGYNFRGIDDFLNALHPLLAEHGVTIAPENIEFTSEWYEAGQNKTQMHSVIQKVMFRFYAPDGSSIAVTTLGEGADTGDKAANKGTSGALKYALMSVFSIPTHDIDDADTHEPEQRQSAPARTSPPPKSQDAPAKPQGGTDEKKPLPPDVRKAWGGFYQAIRDTWGEDDGEMEDKAVKKKASGILKREYPSVGYGDVTAPMLEALRELILSDNNADAPF